MSPHSVGVMLSLVNDALVRDLSLQVREDVYLRHRLIPGDLAGSDCPLAGHVTQDTELHSP